MTGADAAPLNVIYGLYHVDDPTRIRYVGQTCRGINVRMRQHRHFAKADEPFPVYRWIRKHGVDAVGVAVLEVVPSRSDLNVAEQRWIAQFGGIKALLNAREGGMQAGVSEATRAKMRAAKLGVKQPPEQIAKRVAHLVGHSVSDETRERIAVTKRGPRNPQWGKSPSAETRERHLAATSRGENHGRSKATEALVREIRQLREIGRTYAEIQHSIDASLSIPTISSIALRKTWKHVA